MFFRPVLRRCVVGLQLKSPYALACQRLGLLSPALTSFSTKAIASPSSLRWWLVPTTAASRAQLVCSQQLVTLAATLVRATLRLNVLFEQPFTAAGLHAILPELLGPVHWTRVSDDVTIVLVVLSTVLRARSGAMSELRDHSGIGAVECAWQVPAQAIKRRDVIAVAVDFDMESSDDEAVSTAALAAVGPVSG